MIVTFRRRQLPTPAAACRWLFGYPYFIGSINYGIGATILLYESWINHPSNLSDPYTQARLPSPPLHPVLPATAAYSSRILLLHDVTVSTCNVHPR